MVLKLYQTISTIYNNCIDVLLTFNAVMCLLFRLLLQRGFSINQYHKIIDEFHALHALEPFVRHLYNRQTNKFKYVKVTSGGKR